MMMRLVELYVFYGIPSRPIKDTPLHHLLNGAADGPGLVVHPVFEHVLNMKWVSCHPQINDPSSPMRVLFNAFKFQMWMLLSLPRPLDSHTEDDRNALQAQNRPQLARYCEISRGGQTIGRAMHVSESLFFLVLLVPTYWSFVTKEHLRPASCLDGNCSQLSSVGVLRLEQTSHGIFVRHHWINLVSYFGIIMLGVYSMIHYSSALTTLTQAVLTTLLSFCVMEYLHMAPLTSMLIAITYKMVNDVVKLMVLYGVFQVGFGGSFFLVFQDEDSPLNSYSEALLATFLMLFDDFDSDLFLRLMGAKAVVANTLVLLYLVGAMVMLMNLPIAMVSTSYRQVVDSAKVARSIGRAEIILRVESLLPQHIRQIFSRAVSAIQKNGREFKGVR